MHSLHTGPALPKDELLTSDPLKTTPESTPETARGPSPEALGPSLLGPRAQGQSPWVLGATGGPRASGEGPRAAFSLKSTKIHLDILFRTVSRGCRVPQGEFPGPPAVSSQKVQRVREG